MPSIVRVILLALHASFLLLAVLASVNAPVPLGPLEVPRYIVTGAQGGTPPEGAAAPNRIEIHEFVKMDDHFSLYILTLQHMQRQDQKEVDSYFSIAGINGRPYQSWNGSGSMPVDPNAWQGYSQIGNVLFPTWQRVYLVLFEASALQTAAMKIAATYTVDQACFKQAALNLRQPYWDWSLNAVPPAEVIALKKVTIITPNGQKTHVDNPLYCYTFHPIDPSFPPPFSNWTTTLRQPSTNAPDAEDDVSDLRSVLRSLQSELRTGTYNLLRRVRSWEVLSNDNPRAGGSRGNNLEAIHDGVQAYVGGNGQISDPEVAAFDPIFFLHNCNVDRVLSLWSALNPGVWVSPGPPPHGSWTLIPKSAVDKDTDLTPFWKSQNSYWRSSEVTTTAAMGYTYPEFNGLNMSDPSAVRSAIAAKVVRLYA
ncbi:common central domain of tyrosinase-domain-containing protein [Mycena polygramma]|nr:common central domain of tyrosinase-domain-containing protein [Mycena polygramma]